MNITEFARLGGEARMKKLNKAQRRLLALKGVKARLAKKRRSKHLYSPSNEK